MDALLSNTPPLVDRLALTYEDLQTDIAKGLNGVAAFPVTTDEEAIQARDLIMPLKALQGRVEAHRVEEKDFFLKGERAVDAFFKGLRVELDKAVAAIQKAADAYAAKKREDARKVEAAKARVAVAMQEAAPAPVAPKEAVRVATDTGVAMSGRAPWTHEIVDAALLPRELLMPNEAAIKARVAGLKAMGGKIEDAKIPGVRIFEKVTAVFR